MEKSLINQEMLHYSGKKMALAISMILIVNSLIGQGLSREDEKLFFKADQALEYGDFLTALNLYQVIFSHDSTNSELNYKLGICSFAIKKYRMASKKYFSKASAIEYPEVDYYLGVLNHLSKDYDKAINYFNEYKKYKGEKEYTAKQIDDLIAKCNTAKLFESGGAERIKIENMGASINTEFPEYAPLIPAAENFMIYTSRRKNAVWNQKDPMGDYFEDIYMSKKVGDVWQNSTMLDTIINSSVHDASTGLSADGDRLLIYRTSKDMKSGDIYESFYSDEKWSAPQNIGTSVNSPEYLETSACYSPDGDIIFFSSTKTGGYGGKDLYSVKKLPNGKWSEPFNLGPTINTEYNEDAPFVHPSGSTLFFSSEGHKNMGGYDIFKSDFDERGGFTSPQNLGYPVNTVEDDIFFVLSTDASTGYLSSEREGGFGSQDIYKVNFIEKSLPLNVYNICVFDESNNVIKKSEITLVDAATKKVYGIYKSNEQTGKILIISEAAKEYQLTVKTSEYEPFVTQTVLDSESYVSFTLKNKIK